MNNKTIQERIDTIKKDNNVWRKHLSWGYLSTHERKTIQSHIDANSFALNRLTERLAK